MEDVPDIKLIRTDTTLDLSHSAEKRCPKQPHPQRKLAKSLQLACGNCSLNEPQERGTTTAAGTGKIQQQKSTAPRVPRRSPIQVLSRPDDA